jgi:hypothetical protein
VRQVASLQELESIVDPFDGGSTQDQLFTPVRVPLRPGTAPVGSITAPTGRRPRAGSVSAPTGSSSPVSSLSLPMGKNVGTSGRNDSSSGAPSKLAPLPIGRPRLNTASSMGSDGDCTPGSCIQGCASTRSPRSPLSNSGKPMSPSARTDVESRHKRSGFGSGGRSKPKGRGRGKSMPHELMSVSVSPRHQKADGMRDGCSTPQGGSRARPRADTAPQFGFGFRGESPARERVSESIRSSLSQDDVLRRNMTPPLSGNNSRMHQRVHTRNADTATPRKAEMRSVSCRGNLFSPFFL